MSQDTTLEINRDTKVLRGQLQLTKRPSNTFLVVVAVHHEDDKNKFAKISCKWGVPIGGYIYDAINDCYLIKCLDYLNLGNVPVSYKLAIKDFPFWSISAPLPESILKRYMTPLQKSDMKKYKQAMVGCKFYFLQMISHE
jgi:hypothetical protein